MNSPLSDSESAFAQLHPGLQRWIWQQGWPALRPIQAKSIPAILSRQDDVVITAPTAGGKTEAAFLPILSDLAADQNPGLRCLCIAPLRALINDQARRVGAMCDAVELTLQPWHGDVSAGKAAFWKKPCDILMTTPESLEALLMRRSRQLAPMLANLRYLVVDELHAFFGSERGAQLQSLLQRVQHLVGKSVPRIALSATLGDISIARRFLRPDQTRLVQVLSSFEQGGDLKLQLRAIYRPRDPNHQVNGESATREIPKELDPQLLAQLEHLPVSAEITEAGSEGDLSSEQDGAQPDRYLSVMGQIADHLFEKLRGQSNLVFANSRAGVEFLTTSLADMSERKGVPNEFFPHHGSLSRELRLSIEDRLRDGKLPTTAICTSTLEMGIDIGDVASIAQIGSAPTVSSLKQRVGRSGRRAGEAQVLRQYVVLPSLDARSHFVDWLRLPLLEAIAIIELMLEGRFEPPIEGDLHLSTLVQQILSSIVQSGGGLKADALFDDLCRHGAFAQIDGPNFMHILRALGTKSVLEQAEDGMLLPGVEGERLTDHYSFYASFQSPEEFQVFAQGGRRLGSIPVSKTLSIGQLMLFAGRRWSIASIDTVHRTIVLSSSKGGTPPHFGGEEIPIHRIVHERMKQLFKEQELPVYLDRTAQQALIDARIAWRLFELDRQPYLDAGAELYVGHWAGTRIEDTLTLWLKSRGHNLIRMNRSPFLSIKNCESEELHSLIRDALAHPPASALDLIREIPMLGQDKFDHYLDEPILRAGYAIRHFDIDGAREVLKQLLLN